MSGTLRLHSSDRPTPDPTATIDVHGASTALADFELAATRHAGRVAIAGTTVQLTYADVHDLSNRWAGLLTDRNVQRGDVVAIAADRSVDLIPALLGVWKAGAAFAIVDPTYPVERLQRYLGVIRPAARVAVAAHHGLDGSWLTASDLGAPATARPAVGPNDLAYVASTSGTTGTPKAIAADHAPLHHFLQWHVATHHLHQHTRVAILSGLAHDPLLRDMFTPLVVGGTSCVPEQDDIRDPWRLRAFLTNERVTTVHITPSLGQVITHGAHAGELEHLTLACFAGEQLPAALVDRFAEIAPNCRMVNFYGATETPQAMGHHVVTPGGGTPPIGRGIDGVHLLVLDTAGTRLCPPGEVGELYVRTPYLSRGYLGDPDTTAERFVVNPFTGDPSDLMYRSGDLARVRPDGIVEFAGRADSQVKIRGFRVEPAEVEHALASHPGIRRAVVEGVADADGHHLEAWFEGDVSSREALAHLGALVPDYMVPRRMHAVTSFQLTPNGKIDREAMRALARTETVPHGEPSDGDAVTETEVAVRDIWRSALDLDSLAVTTDFADAGGHSLVALRVLTMVKERFGVQLPLSVFITDGTVRQMAALLSEGGPITRKLIVALQPEGHQAAVFYLPGGGGLSVMAFRRLAELMGPNRPAFGIEADLDPATAPTTIPEMAARYIDEMRAQHPHGPYHLFGYSLGAYVAYEMARQLRASGAEVGALVVFDAPSGHPLTRSARLAGRLQIGWWRARRRLSAGGIGRAGRRVIVRTVGRIRTRIDGTPATAVTRTVLDELVATNQRMAEQFAAAGLPPYDGEIIVILAADAPESALSARFDERRGWARLSPTVRFVDVPGDHLSMIELPAAPHVAARLSELLAERERAITNANQRPSTAE
jgi:amino acid adenylation domain-containing protein